MRSVFYTLLGGIGALSVVGLIKLRRKHGRMMMGFGNREEWERFNKEFPKFVEKLGALQALRDRIFVRKIFPNHHGDLVIYGLGRACVEDFEQVLNLCGNGFGIGALQMLRGMYERQVTAAYLSNYPDEVDQFIQYDCVHSRKLLNQFKDVYKDAPEILNRIVSQAEQKDIEDNYQGVRTKFLRTKCKNCKTQEEMFSWSKLDIGAMALRGAQPALKDFYPYQYTRPLLMAHSTFKSVGVRVVEKADGSISFESEGQRSLVKESLVGGHHLLIHVFDLQNKHFKLGLEDALEECERDYLTCWAPEYVA